MKILNYFRYGIYRSAPKYNIDFNRLIADTGDTFYAELTDYDPDQIDDWLQENVLNNLVLHRPDNTLVVSGHDVSLKEHKELKNHLGRWLNQRTCRNMERLPSVRLGTI
jgi:hypothetical protein